MTGFRGPGTNYPATPGEAWSEGMGLYLKSDGKWYKASAGTKPPLAVALSDASADDVTNARKRDVRLVGPTCLGLAGGAFNPGAMVTPSTGKFVDAGADATYDGKWSAGIALEAGADGAQFEFVWLTSTAADQSAIAAD